MGQSEVKCGCEGFATKLKMLNAFFTKADAGETPVFQQIMVDVYIVHVCTCESLKLMANIRLLHDFLV